MKKMVDAETWISAFYFSGHISMNLYPFWRERFVELVNSEVNEIILYGGIGGGKTYFANVLLLWRLYQLAELGEGVWDYLGLARGTGIYFIYFTVTREQAELTGFKDLKLLVDNIPYFREKFQRDKSVNSVLRFPNSITVLSGSKFHHQIGLNVMGAVLDEANFRLAKDAFQDALNLYNAITARQLSRFVRDGKNLGMFVLISSAKEPSSFLETKIKDANKSKNVKVICVRSYEVKSEEYGNKEFWVFTGYGGVPPRMIESLKDLKEIGVSLGKIKEEEVLKAGIEGTLKERFSDLVGICFVKVPVVFKKVFESDLQLAIRDIIGYGVENEDKFFRSEYLYSKAVEGENIFRKEVIELSMFDEMQLIEWFDRWKNKDKDKVRVMHIDTALKVDRLGIASAYVDRVVDVEGQKLPVVRVEWMVAVERSKRYRMDDEIPFYKIRQFLRDLKNLGINVKKVTFDKFQSADMIQLLKREGFEVDLLSVDKDDDVYKNLSMLYVEGRIKHPDVKLYRKELFDLEYDRKKRKIDHPENGSKDLSDAVAGAVWNVVKEFNFAVHNMEEFARYPEEVSYQEDLLDVLMKEARRKRVGNWWDML